MHALLISVFPARLRLPKRIVCFGHKRATDHVNIVLKTLTALPGQIATLLLMLALAACASRPGPNALQAVNTDLQSNRVATVYLATSRARDSRSGTDFNNDISESLNFAEYRVSIPPGHKPGQVEVSGGKSNPAKDFVVVSKRSVDRAEFLRDVAKAAGGDRGNISVFVHGYNTNLAEAIFRQAQITADSGQEDHGAAILFSWPSVGSYSGYIADSAAATSSRDQLADLLTSVTSIQGKGNVTLIGHSMGGWLAAESLRQLRLMKRDAVTDRLKVVLAAPDIDTQVFIAQMQVIGRLREPMTLLVSRDDIALSVSSFISNDNQKIGKLDVSQPEIQAAAKKANVQVVDISNVASNDAFKHNRFASLAVYFPAIKKADQKGGDAKLKRAGVYIFDTVGKTLTAPLVLGQHIAQGG